MGKKQNLIGQRFGLLTVIKESGKRSNGGRILWECLCDCGNKSIVLTASLKSGNTKSCGCLQKKITREISTQHGLYESSTYRSWAMMKQRCLNKNYSHYHLYGGRGIKICKEWIDDFKSFLRDMGFRPEKTSLERIDNDGDYCPQNCKWATQSEQIRNQDRNRLAKGYTYCKKTHRWIAQIFYDNANHYLGHFDSKNEAHKAYINAKAQIA